MTTITHEQIRALRDEAGQAGDLLQAAICQIALHGEPLPRTYAVLSPDERDALRQQYGQRNGWSKAAAIAECECVIADAAARAAIAALRAIADPNKIDASRAPLPDNLARRALSWLAARPEFENARAVLRLYDRSAS